MWGEEREEGRLLEGTRIWFIRQVRGKGGRGLRRAGMEMYQRGSEESTGGRGEEGGQLAEWTNIWSIR